MDDQGRVWFITGTSSGFGRCLAEEVLARGERVVATARDPHTLDDLLARGHDRVHTVRLDVTRPPEIRDAVDSALRRFGAIDVLVNNAGYSVVGAVEETSDEELRATLEPMFFGAVAMTLWFCRTCATPQRDHRADHQRGRTDHGAGVRGVQTVPRSTPWRPSPKAWPRRWPRSACGC